MIRVVRARRTARPRPAGARRRGAGPWRVILVLLGLLLVQGPTLLHLLLVPHATCEHGELIEAGAARAEARAPDSSAESPQIEQGDKDGGHDHCDVLAVHHRPVEAVTWVGEASLTAVTPVEPGGQGVETRPLAILAVAPKGSPPV